MTPAISRMFRKAADLIDDRCDAIVDEVLAAPFPSISDPAYSLYRRRYPMCLDVMTEQSEAYRKAAIG